jgi:hypothetical protein
VNDYQEMHDAIEHNINAATVLQNEGGIEATLSSSRLWGL